MKPPGFGLHITCGSDFEASWNVCSHWGSLWVLKLSKSRFTEKCSYLTSILWSVRGWGQSTTILTCLNSLLGNIKQNPNTQSLSQTGKKMALMGPGLV